MYIWTRFLLGILLLEPCISVTHARKTNKYIDYSFSLLIMYGSSYMFRHYIAIASSDVVRFTHNVTRPQHAHPQYSIDCSSIEHLSEGTRRQCNAETCRSYHT